MFAKGCVGVSALHLILLKAAEKAQKEKATREAAEKARKAGKMLVPNALACDQGLATVGKASCELCKKYVDGRVGSGFGGQPCVYVPSRARCYPQNHAVHYKMEFVTDCIEQAQQRTAQHCPASWAQKNFRLLSFVSFSRSA